MKQSVVTRINSALRCLRILAMLEHAPKYPRQIAQIHPELFVSDSTLIVGARQVTKVPAANIYMVFGRLARTGLIRATKNYRAASQPTTRRITWYELTPQGRRMLRESREALKAYIGEPTC